jgi:hypothetical protein
MTRTTQVLKRLGVASVVAATVAAGIPALAAMGANAATTYTNITLSPKNTSSTQGACTAFTATVSPGPSSTSETATVSVQIRQTVNNSNNFSTTTAPKLTFCTPAVSGGQGPDNGVVRDQSYTGSNSPTNTPAAGQTCQGSQINAGTGTPSTTTQCEADFSTISGRTCTVTSGGLLINGANVRYVVTSGPDQNTNNGTATQGIACTASSAQNANGQSICRVNNTSGALGTDSILFYVESNGQAGPQTGEATDTATGSFTGAARNIACAPKTQTVQSAGVSTVTCTVTDAKGNPVAPSTSANSSQASATSVRFTSTGAGRFTDGRTDDVVQIGTNGQASIQTTSQVNETGDQTVTGTLVDAAFPNSSQAGNASSECNRPSGFTYSNTFPAPTSAGNCTDSVTRTYTASGTPSPTATSTATPTATTPAGRSKLGLTVNTPLVPAGSNASVTVTGAANQGIELVCYSRPSTTYNVVRSATIDAAGDAVTFSNLAIGRNTRCYARYTTNNTQGQSDSGVINARTVISLSAVRTGVRTYTFQGRNLPRASGQLITLYRVDNNGNEIRTSNLVTDSSGIYRVSRQFTGSGTFQFKVRTSTTLNNTAGVSNTYTVNVH